jgi:DNA-directed RNA polymerase specialized sigma24 family protein
VNTGTVKEKQYDADDTGRVDGDLDEAVAIFVKVRPRLMAIAYRILGTTSEAEEVVQESWLTRATPRRRGPNAARPWSRRCSSSWAD